MMNLENVMQLDLVLAVITILCLICPWNFTTIIMVAMLIWAHSLR